MKVIEALISNRVLVSGALGWLIAQGIKTCIDIWYSRSFSVERLWGSGGMSSSHSATVCALTTSSAFLYGLSSFEFAISFLLASIVMYDAMGVRRETRKQAKLLNIILENHLFEETSPEAFKEKLKEFVGHTPLQVFAGAIIGILVGIISVL